MNASLLENRLVHALMTRNDMDQYRYLTYVDADGFIPGDLEQTGLA
jgi:hypothetical protein